MKRQPHRQGDVLFVPIDKIPDGVEVVPRDARGRIVLAEGEETGHAHCVLDDPATLFTTSDLNEMADRFLMVEQGASVVHEQHNTVELEKGSWAVRPKREYAPERSHAVMD